MSIAVFVILAAVAFVILASTGLYYSLRARHASRDKVAELIARLRPLQRKNIEHVALDLLEEHPKEPSLDPSSLWDMIGGMDGLAALEENCDVLIDLTAHVAQLYPDAMYIADDLRLNSREIKWHVSRLRAAEITGHQKEQFSTYAQRAVATYYLMTQSVLLLYETVRVPGLPDLQAAL